MEINQQHARVVGSNFVEGNNYGSISSAHNKMDLIESLENLKEEFSRNLSNQKPGEQGAEAKKHLTEAIEEIKKPQPDRGTVIQALEKAKKFTEGFTGLASAIAAAEKVVRAIL
jgi:hypothetical protein